MKELLIEPHYLGSLEYFVLIQKYKRVVWEVEEHFIKQTFRNRFEILSANGIQKLSVPVIYSNRTKFRDVKIDYSQSWVNIHKRALLSSYAKAPYFEHFQHLFWNVWDSKPVFLLDLNLEMMSICLKILQIDRPIIFTENYNQNADEGLFDSRNTVWAKKAYQTRNIYKPTNYYQSFGSEFVPNLSVVDLLMCEGLNALQVLRDSDKNHGEQI